MKNHTTEIGHMWNTKSDYINNKRGNWNHLKIIEEISEQIRGKHEIMKLQKTAILGSAHTYCGKY